MLGLMGMTQVVATIAYGIRGLRRGETTWDWPAFDPNPEQENLAQMSRWSLNSTPEWIFPPLAIANQYHDKLTNQTKRVRYRLILVRGSFLEWLKRDRLQEVRDGLALHHKWIPEQDLPFTEIVLYAYAADCTPHPTYVCLPSGLYKARNGQVVSRSGPTREIIPLPGIYFFDGWRVRPTLTIPADLPHTKETPVRENILAPPTDSTDSTRTPEEEARDILAAAAKNQVENGPGTRRAAVRACKYLRAIVNEYGSIIDKVHAPARIHTQRSKGTIAQTTQYQLKGTELPVITPALTSELLHCLSALPDPWPLAKIKIDMEKPSQWVSKLSRLYFADEYARRTFFPSNAFMAFARSFNKFVLAGNWIGKFPCMSVKVDEPQKKAIADLYIVQSAFPGLMSRTQNKKQNKKHKENKHTKTKTKHKNQQTKTRPKGIATRLEILVAMASCVPCTTLAIIAKQNKPNKPQKQDGHRRWEKQQSTLRKPRIPPARIPEITMCSHSGITFHLCTTKQTPTTPGRNEVVKIEKVKQSMKMI